MTKILLRPPSPPVSTSGDSPYRQYSVARHLLAPWKEVSGDWFVRAIDLSFDEKYFWKFNPAYPKMVVVSKILTREEISAIFGYQEPGSPSFSIYKFRTVSSDMREDRLWRLFALAIARFEKRKGKS